MSVVIGKPHSPVGGGAYIAGNVDSDALFFEPGKVFAKRPPVNLDAVVIELLLIGSDNRVIQRGDGLSLAGDFGGDSLVDLRGQAGLHGEGGLQHAKHGRETQST